MELPLEDAEAPDALGLVWLELLDRLLLVEHNLLLTLLLLGAPLPLVQFKAQWERRTTPAARPDVRGAPCSARSVKL